jgi:hypothetical protein
MDKIYNRGDLISSSSSFSSSSSSYKNELNYLSFCKNSYLKTTLVISNLKKEEEEEEAKLVKIK